MLNVNRSLLAVRCIAWLDAFIATNQDTGR
jgi:hypothetical protein